MKKIFGEILKKKKTTNIKRNSLFWVIVNVRKKRIVTKFTEDRRYIFRKIYKNNKRLSIELAVWSATQPEDLVTQSSSASGSEERTIMVLIHTTTAQPDCWTARQIHKLQHRHCTSSGDTKKFFKFLVIKF